MAHVKPARLSFSYDTAADVLYVSIGRPKQAVGEMLENGVILRRNPKTQAVVGFTIVDFTQHFASRNAQPITTPVSAQLQPV